MINFDIRLSDTFFVMVNVSGNAIQGKRVLTCEGHYHGRKVSVDATGLAKTILCGMPQESHGN